MFRFLWKLHNKRKSACKMFRQITFQSISGSKAMDWNFQSVKKNGTIWWKKKRGQEVEFQEWIEKSEHACSVEGIFLVSDPTARLFWRWPARLGQIKACLSNDSYKSDKQKSRTLGLTGKAIWINRLVKEKSKTDLFGITEGCMWPSGCRRLCSPGRAMKSRIDGLMDPNCTWY